MKTKTTLIIGLLSLLVFSCDRRVVTRTDTETSGSAVMAADECYSPIIKEELDVFTGLNPEATVTPLYLGEKEIFELLLTDSVRLIMAARDLTYAEKEKIKENKLTLRTQLVARDGIALIVNKQNPDSIINFSLIEKILTGEITKWRDISGKKAAGIENIEVVFDNPNSSTLRYMNDSIVKGKTLSTGLRALNSNPEVINFVANTPDALGIIGVNWISNPYDSTKLSFDEKIRVMQIGRKADFNLDNTFKPYPVFLNNHDYPLIRDVYLILTDLRETLPAGIVKFIAGDAGQRIILKAGLVPGTRPTREIYLKDDF
jgi:phosphate transport system substrate-binding protein